MPGTATITGKVGPAATLTAKVFQNVSFFSIDTTNELLDLIYANSGEAQSRIQIDISAATTITCTVSGNTYTLTIS